MCFKLDLDLNLIRIHSCMKQPRNATFNFSPPIFSSRFIIVNQSDYFSFQFTAFLIHFHSIFFFTFWVFVEVCDVLTFIRANCFSADAVTYCFLLNMDGSEGAISSPLPVDFITVHLEQKESNTQYLQVSLGLI